MASYASRVKRDIDRWAAAGLVDAATADRLARDISEHDRRSLSFGSVLAVMAALLLGAAILIFIAANWDAFPRIARVASLFAVIAAGYVGGALLKLYDHAAIGEACWLVAAAAFGGTIALLGQMYHMTGDEAQAILVWCAGTALAAAALRSNPLTVAAAGIGIGWMTLLGADFFSRTQFPHLFLAIAAVLWLLSLWTQSSPARHLLLLALVFYAVLLATEYEVVAVAGVLVVVSILLMIAAVAAPAEVDRIVLLDGNLPVHAMIGFLAGIAMLQLEWHDEPGFLPASAVALAGIAAAIVLAGRESRGLRWLGYVGFAFELCIVYTITVGSMLGTAGFFLAAALILGGLAFLIIRFEKRMLLPAAEVAA